MRERIAVLIVDDHPLVRKGVRSFLETDPGIIVVAEAADGHEAVTLARTHAPDVALVDLLLPGMDGVEATREIISASPRTRVIVLTSFHQDEHIFPAIRAGAISYLLKDIEPAELASAVRLAAHGRALIDPRVAARLVGHIRGGAEPNPFRELSEREMEVLRLVAAGRHNSEIAEELFIGETTVKSHVSSILGKLGLTDRTQAAVLAWKMGVVRSDEGPGSDGV